MSFYNHEKMRALTIAARASDAYSADRFGPVLWVEAAQMLFDMGLDESEVEGVLRSKLTRWCRDSCGEPSTYLGALFREVSILMQSGRLEEYL